MSDIFDELAKRIADRFRSVTVEAMDDCKEVAEEEINEFFDNLMEATKKQKRKYVRKAKAKVKTTTGKLAITSRKESKIDKLIHILNTGPVLKKDLMRDLDFKTDAAIHNAISVAKKLLKKQKKTIVFEKGNKNKGSIYAIRSKS